MGFCPKCKSEYREGFDTCYDCGVDLVDKLELEQVIEEEEKASSAGKMEFLGSVDDMIALNYITSLLDERGIDYAMSTSANADFTQVISNLYSSAKPPAKDIYVEKDHLNEAMEIVVSIMGQPVEDDQ